MAADAEKDGEKSLELRRYEAELNTVDQVIALGYRLQARCFRCERVRPIDLRRLSAQGLGGKTVRSLADRVACSDCKARGRKMSIHPAGHDTMIKLLFPGETS